MGLPTMRQAMGYLKNAGIRVEQGYPGRVMPHLTGAVAAVNTKRIEDRERTFMAAVCAPQILGAEGCETMADRVAAAWLTAGAVCTYGQCRFDGQSALYILEVQGTWKEETQ